MTTVNLITSRNDELNRILSQKGHTLIEHDPCADAPLLINTIQKHPGNFTIYEITSSDQPEYKKSSDILKGISDCTEVICISDAVPDELYSIFCKSGTPDCLQNYNPEILSGLIELLTKQNINTDNSYFLILDDNPIHKKMLASIIRRFGFYTDFITKPDEIFDRIKNRIPVMLLLNLGTGNLDINDIIRKSYSSSDIKKLPVIAYKSMEEGLFVHELTSGLNRLTKVILSPEELYSMLVDILFKKEIITLTGNLADHVKFHELKAYSGLNIQQIYYANNKNLCRSDSLFEQGNITKLLSDVNRLETAIIRINSISWMNKNPSQGKKTICGVDV